MKTDRVFHNIKSFPKPTAIVEDLSSEVDFTINHFSPWKRRNKVLVAEMNTRTYFPNAKTFLTRCFKAVVQFKFEHPNVKEFYVRFDEKQAMTKFFFTEQEA